jgi:hypothetical protein
MSKEKRSDLRATIEWWKEAAKASQARTEHLLEILAEFNRIQAWNDALLEKDAAREAMARNALRALGASRSKKVDVFEARAILRRFLDG